MGARHENGALGKGYFLTDDDDQVTWDQFQSEVLRKSSIARVRTVDLPEHVGIDCCPIGGELASRIDKKPRLLNLQKAKMVRPAGLDLRGRRGASRTLASRLKWASPTESVAHTIGTWPTTGTGGVEPRTTAPSARSLRGLAPRLTPPPVKAAASRRCPVVVIWSSK